MFVITASGVLADLTVGAEVKSFDWGVALYRTDCAPLDLCDVKDLDEAKRIVRELGRCIAEGLLCVEMEEVVRRAKERGEKEAAKVCMDRARSLVEQWFSQGNRVAALKNGDVLATESYASPLLFDADVTWNLRNEEDRADAEYHVALSLARVGKELGTQA